MESVDFETVLVDLYKIKVSSESGYELQPKQTYW